MGKLIILGAGANVDFGFPTGIELSKSIHSIWNELNEKYITFLLLALSKHRKKYDYFGNHRAFAAERIKRLSDRFYYAGTDSIDDFLSHLVKDFEVSFGKLTLLNLILEKERCSINTGYPNNLFKWESNWLRILFRKEFKFETIEKLNEKLTNNPVKFITFNYDRSLEHFIFTAIKNYYGIEQEDAISIYKKIEFYHVYGALAPLEWESDDPNNRLKIGDDFKDFPYNMNEKLYSCTSNIKVINENRNRSKSLDEKCMTWIQESDKVYILGFGFLESNYKLLGIEEYKQSCKNKQLPSDKFYCTTDGLSENKKADVSKKFGFVVSGICRAKLYDSKIYDYMLHYY